MVSKRWGDIERRRLNDRILGLIKFIILDNTWKTSDIEEPGKSFAGEWSEKCKRVEKAVIRANPGQFPLFQV